MLLFGDLQLLYLDKKLELVLHEASRPEPLPRRCLSFVGESCSDGVRQIPTPFEQLPASVGRLWPPQLQLHQAYSIRIATIGTWPPTLVFSLVMPNTLKIAHSAQS
jgi:hypothetical protein